MLYSFDPTSDGCTPWRCTTLVRPALNRNHWGAKLNTVHPTLSSIDIQTHPGSIRSDQAATHSCDVLSKCCLISELEWQLVPPTCQGHNFLWIPILNSPPLTFLKGPEYPSLEIIQSFRQNNSASRTLLVQKTTQPIKRNDRPEQMQITFNDCFALIHGRKNRDWASLLFTPKMESMLSHVGPFVSLKSLSVFQSVLLSLSLFLLFLSVLQVFLCFVLALYFHLSLSFYQSLSL